MCHAFVTTPHHESMSIRRYYDTQHSGDDVVDHFAMDVRQPAIDAVVVERQFLVIDTVVVERQFLVIDTEKVKQRCVEVVPRHRIVPDLPADVVRCPYAMPGFSPPPAIHTENA